MALFLTNGVHGVGAQVDHDLMHLSRHGHDGAVGHLIALGDLNVFGQIRAQETDRFLDVVYQFNQLGAGFFLTAEGDQMRDHLFGPVGALEHFHQFLSTVAIGVQIFSGQLGISDHGTEDVVKVMRDATRETSDGFQTLSAFELLFPQDLISDVLAAGYDAGKMALVIDHRLDYHVQGDLGAVLADHIHFAPPGLRRSHPHPGSLHFLAAVLIEGQKLQRFVQKLRAGITNGFFKHGVHVVDKALG